MSGNEVGNSPGLCPLKGQYPDLSVRLGPKISFRACLWVVIRPHHIVICWFSIQHFIFSPIFCLETPKASSGPTNWKKVTPLASSLAILFPHKPLCPGTQNSPTECWMEMSFNAFWHCWTNGDVVLAAWRAFRATSLSEKIVTHFSGLAFIWISWAQAKIACISAWKTVAYFPRQMLSLLSEDCQ